MLKVKLTIGIIVSSFIIFGLVFFYHSNQVKNISPGSTSPYVGAVLPHHLLAKDLIDDFFSRLNYYPKKIYIIGPNHFELGNSPVITNDNSESNQLIGFDFIRTNNNIISQEHSINVFQDIFINKYPESLIIPLIISSKLSNTDLEKLVDYLVQNTDDKTLIICSTDFSHYRSLHEANDFDQTTIDLISKKKYSEIYQLDNNYIDSPKSVLILLKTLGKIKKDKITIIDHSNSAIISHDFKNPSTTSYFELVFQ